MPRVAYTDNLQRHVACPPVEIGPAATVREALDLAFESNPDVRPYILDEHGALRKHMNIFVDGRMIFDRQKLSDSISENAEIYVMQALSGG